MNKKILSILFAVLIFIGCGISKIEAEDVYNTYKVTIEGGQYGTVNGNDSFELTVHAGDELIMLNLEDLIKPNTEKYRFIGFHISGQMDNQNDVFSKLGNTVVDKDLNLVATYGFSGNLVEYHVYYTNTAGDELYPMDVFYGNEGDKPVIAYRYISGYEPKVTSYSAVLPTKASGEILEFTFVYTKVEYSETEIEDDPNVIYTFPARRESTVVPEVVEEVIEEVVEVPEPTPTPSPTPTPEPEPEPEPEQKTILEQIGDMLTPLVNFVNETIETNPVLGYSLAALLVIFGLLLLGFLIFLIFLLFRRKKRDGDQNQRPQAA
ncbi:MAG: hypothetical protein K6A70_11260 [Erysipelotrichaceae bacterium]|nr:hypothetical protein [Erysipelotrichaceae bacterium]